METSNITSAPKVLYTGKTHTTGGRDGTSRSSDGNLDIKLSFFGTSGKGTNPEQLFAAGWSACFLSGLSIAAAQQKLVLPQNHAVDAEIDLCAEDGAYYLQARLKVSLPGIKTEIAQALINTAHQTCPYSKATLGNIKVEITLINE